MHAQPLGFIWFVQPPLASLAESDGDYARHGLKVSGIVTRSSDQQYEALTSGSVDAAVTAMDNVFGWNRRGSVQDLVIAAQLECSTALALYARPGIDRIEQLEGAELLVDSPHNGFVVVLRALLHDAGIGKDNYRMTVAGGVRERLEALMAGRGDATLLGPPFDAIAQAKGLPLLRHVNMAYPEFPGQGLVVRREVLTRKMAAFRAWIEVMETVRQRYRGNEAAAVGTLISQGLPESAAHSLLAGVPDSFDVHDPGIKLLIRQRQVLGLPGADSCPEDLVDDRLLTAER